MERIFDLIIELLYAIFLLKESLNNDEEIQVQQDLFENEDDLNIGQDGLKWEDLVKEDRIKMKDKKSKKPSS